MFDKTFKVKIIILFLEKNKYKNVYADKNDACLHMYLSIQHRIQTKIQTFFRINYQNLKTCRLYKLYLYVN